MASVYPSSIACKLKIGWPSGSEDFFFFFHYGYILLCCVCIFVFSISSHILFLFCFVVVVAFLTTGLIEFFIPIKDFVG